MNTTALLARVLLPLTLCGAPAVEAETPPLNVVIVAVSEWDDTEWQSTKLSTSIAKAAGSLVGYFQHNFSGATITVLQSKEETTRESIRQSLEVELRQQGSHTLNLVFFLSHGISVAGGTEDYPNDLLLVTSDTLKAQPRNKGILAGANLVRWFEQLPEGSVVLAFIDSCFSGALESVDVALGAKLKALNGLHMMVMTSGVASEVTYQAVFTRALLNLWETANSSGPCTQFEDVPLREKMQELLEFEFDVAEGHPQVIVEYSGSLCVENFTQHRGLLLLYNGSRNDVVYRVVAEGDEKAELTVRKKKARFLRLDKSIYSVELYQKGKLTRTESVDLVTRNFSTVMHGVRRRQELAGPYREFSLASSKVGIGRADEEVIGAVASVLAGETGLLTAAEAYANAPLDRDEHDRSSLARVAVLRGDYLKAARLWLRAARESGMATEKLGERAYGQRAYGRRAYYALAAAGRPRRAAEAQRKYQVAVEECPECAKAAQDVNHNLAFRTLVRPLQLKAVKWSPPALLHYQAVHEEQALVSAVVETLEHTSPMRE